MSVTIVDSKAKHDYILGKLPKNSLRAIYFWATWSPECKLMGTVVEALAKENPFVTFLSVEAEEVEGVADLYPIDSVPAVVILKGNGSKPVEVIIGANPPGLVQAIKKHSAETPAGPQTTESKEDLNSRLGKLINAAPVMLFMKGSPEAAKCKFSRKMVAMLKEQKVVYSYFDILSDDTVRQGLKTYSNWKTYPQLYIKGKLIGGVDVVEAHIDEEEFQDLLPKDSTKGGLEDKLKRLISQSKIMLFMKGSPETPKCGFSKSIVKILNESKIPYGSFDILMDMEVRQGLKTFSNWKTYPQLYVNGKLVGGLDVVQELQEDGELMDVLKGE